MKGDKQKSKNWELKMIIMGKRKRPTGWKEVTNNVFAHKLGRTKFYKETKGIHKNLWRATSTFPEYHKELTTRGFDKKTDIKNFIKGYLQKYPYG